MAQMETMITIGMPRAGLKKLGERLVAEAGKEGEVEVVRYNITSNDGDGPDLTLKFTNDGMDEGRGEAIDAAYWEKD